MVNPNRGAAWRGGAGGRGGGYVNGRGGGPSTPVQTPTTTTTTTTSTNVDNVSNGTTVVSNRGGVGAPFPRGGRGFYPYDGSGSSRGSVSWDRGRGVPRGGFRDGFRGRRRGSFAAPLSS